MNKKVLYSVIDQVASSRQLAIAIKEENKSISYSDLKTQSDRVGDFLRGQGVKKGDRIGVFLPNGINHVISFLGVSKGMGIFFPLDIDYPVKRFENLINNVAPKFILTDNEHLAALQEMLNYLDLNEAYLNKIILLTPDCKPLCFLKKEFEQVPVVSSEEVTGEDTMYLLNTSGSTGNPKIIKGMHKSVSHFVHWEVNTFGLNHDTYGCVLARPSFDLNLREVFAPLLAGGTLFVPENEIKANPQKLIFWIKEHSINLIHPIPSIFRLLMQEVAEDEYAKDCLSSLTNVLFAGEALFGKDIHEWHRVGNTNATLANLFGPSETTLAKIHYPISAPENYQASEIIPLGKPLPNTTIMLMDQNRLCNPGAVGEILIKTPFRSKGYYKNDELTSEKFVQNPLHSDFEDIVYKTGDLGRLREDGILLFVGRKDRQVKIRGNRIELQEVEKCILKYTGIDQVVVSAVKNTRSENVLVCYYTASISLKEHKIRAYLKHSLPEYMFPSYYIKMDEFPLNFNGKIDRKSLKPPEELLYENTSFEAPKSPVEKILAEIWSDVLGLEKIGINNSFYELGGHSLSVAKVVSRVFGALGVDLTLRDVFKNSSIKKLARHITALKTSTEMLKIELAPKLDSYELTYNQKSIWLAAQTDEGNLAYNIPCAFILRGQIEVEILRKAFQLLLVQHESLRSVISLENGEPRQRIWDAQDFKFELHIGKKSREIKERAFIADVLNKELQTPFEIENQLLLRAQLMEIQNNKWLFIFTIHHIISDGWSREILFNDLINLYKALLADKNTTYKEQQLQYKDYTFWHNNKLITEKEDRSKAYWVSNFEEGWPAIELKTDFPRKNSRGWQGDIVTSTLEAELIGKIIRFNQLHDCSLFMVITTAINIVLAKRTGLNEIVVGSPFAGRKYRQFEDIIGLFVTVLPLKVVFEEEDSYLDIIEKVRETILDSHDHQDFPFEAISHTLSQGQTEDNYAFNILIQTQQFANKTNAIEGVVIEPYELSMPSSKVDITFDISLGEEDAVITTEFDSDLFKKESISVLHEELKMTLNMLLQNPDDVVSTLKFKGSGEEALEEDQFLNKMMGIDS